MKLSRTTLLFTATTFPLEVIRMSRIVFIGLGIAIAGTLHAPS